MLTKEELIAQGWEERFIIDRATHPRHHMASWPVTGTGEHLLGPKVQYRLPHIASQSIVVTVISNNWLEGGWHRVQDMLRYTEKAGYTVAFEEVDDMSIMPNDAIGIMRSGASLLALDAGAEWCLMVDTDALLEQDTLMRLLQWDRPIVFPYLVDLEKRYPGSPLSYPKLEPNTGLQPVVWAAASVMLFNTKVFNCLDAYAWHGSDYHFAQHLAHYGHRIHVDTDTIVSVSRGPTYDQSKTWDELRVSQRSGYERRQNQDRDRRPPPGFDPAFGEGMVTKDGVYLAVDPYKHRRANGPQSGVENTQNGHFDTNPV